MKSPIVKKKIVICLPTEHSRNVSVRLRLNLNLKVLVFKKRVKPKYPKKNRFELSNRFNTLQLNKTVFNLVHSSVLLQFIDLCILLGCDYCDSIKGTKRFLCNSCILLGIAGLSLRAGGRGFPPATQSMAPGYFRH